MSEAKTDNALEGISLMDLAGLDTSGLEAKRIGDILPRMLADFECTTAELKENKDAATGKVKSFMATFGWKVNGIHILIDKDGPKEADLIGKIHSEVRVITNTEGIQYLLGFIEDVGVKQRGPLKSLMESVIGKRVKATLAHRKDKNDADRVFSGLSKIKPI